MSTSPERISRRRLFQAGGVTLGSLALPGCSGGEQAAGDRPLDFQGWDYEPQAVERNLARFTERSGIAVDFTSITGSQYVQKSIAEFTAGTEPDTLYVYDDERMIVPVMAASVLSSRFRHK